MSTPAKAGVGIALALCAMNRVAVTAEAFGALDWSQLVQNGIGIAFLIGAVYAFVRVEQYQRVGWYFLLQGFHWGGAATLPLPQTYLLLVYLGLSSILASACLLHFAMDRATTTQVRWPIYLPVVAMFVSLLLVPFDIKEVLESIVGICMFLASVLYPLVAVVLLMRFAWPTPVRVRALCWLAPVVIASIASITPQPTSGTLLQSVPNVLYVAQVMFILTIALFHAEPSST